MTNAEKIAKSAKRGRVALIIAVAAACGFGLYAIVVNVQQGNDITNVHNDVTKIEQTPCTKGAASKACQEYRAEIERKASELVTCIPFREAGYHCPLPGSPLASAPSRAHLSAPDQPQGGDASQTGSTGHQQPSPSGGSDHGGGTPHSSPHQVTPPPGNQPPSSLPSNSPPTSTGSSAGSATPPTPTSPPPAAVEEHAPIREAAGTVLGETAETVNGVVCSLTSACPTK